MNSQAKGSDLERAVELLEKNILAAVPGLSDKTYRIYTRKIIVVDGVKHEIDVWVEFDIGGGYHSTFIFECKNWDAPVGKNEIIVFSTKVDAAQAQRGFFVAKSYTQYAVAAAALDARITLLEVTENFPISNVIGRFHQIVRDMSKSVSNLQFVSKNPVIGGTEKPIDMQTAIFLLKGERIDGNGYVLQHINRLVETHLNKLPTQTFENGVYIYELKEEVPVDADNLIVDNMEIGKLLVSVKYQVEVFRADPRTLDS